MWYRSNYAVQSHALGLSALPNSRMESKTNGSIMCALCRESTVDIELVHWCIQRCKFRWMDSMTEDLSTCKLCRDGPFDDGLMHWDNQQCWCSGQQDHSLFDFLRWFCAEKRYGVLFCNGLQSVYIVGALNRPWAVAKSTFASLHCFGATMVDELPVCTSPKVSW